MSLLIGIETVKNNYFKKKNPLIGVYLRNQKHHLINRLKVDITRDPIKNTLFIRTKK